MRETNARCVLSRCPEAEGERRKFEDAVRDALVSRGVGVLMVPHLYYLRPDHPAALLICGLHDGAAVGAWLHPRASRWTLHALLGGGRERLEVNDMGQFCCPEMCAEKLLAGVRERAGGAAPREGSVREVTGPVGERWYPVLDYDRCSGCGQCLEFCLFGVYSERDGRVMAEQPDNCKPGCPACARVCPEGAIMFPHYVEDPGIAGAPGAEVGQAEIDVAAFFQSRAGAGADECECSDDGAKGTDMPADRTSGDKRDDLDDLIDALDDLNE